MLRRLNKILKSLRKKGIVKDKVISTTVDDTLEGKRITFNKSRVDHLLAQCDLLEKDGVEATSVEEPKHRKELK